MHYDAGCEMRPAMRADEDHAERHAQDEQTGGGADHERRDQADGIHAAFLRRIADDDDVSHAVAPDALHGTGDNGGGV